MPVPFNPDLFVARWYCSTAHTEDMPLFAQEALEAGHDGPALRRLAGFIKPTSRDIGTLFQDALQEIGNVKISSEEQALRYLSRAVTADIVEGRIDPIRGAEILASFAAQYEYPPFLADFFQIADLPRWGEHAPPRSKLIEDIFERARLLLAHLPE